MFLGIDNGAFHLLIGESPNPAKPELKIEN
jgi:hypothetical protein